MRAFFRLLIVLGLIAFLLYAGIQLMAACLEAMASMQERAVMLDNLSDDDVP